VAAIWRSPPRLSAPLAFTGEEFVNLFNKEADDPEDGFDFGEHAGNGSVGFWLFFGGGNELVSYFCAKLDQSQ
jgi:hypothetical protein